jgi:hypothetical protein
MYRLVNSGKVIMEDVSDVDVRSELQTQVSGIVHGIAKFISYIFSYVLRSSD